MISTIERRPRQTRSQQHGDAGADRTPRPKPARLTVLEFDRDGWQELSPDHPLALADCPAPIHGALTAHLEAHGFYLSREFPSSMFGFDLYQKCTGEQIPQRWAVTVTEGDTVHCVVLLNDFPQLAGFIRECQPAFAL